MKYTLILLMLIRVNLFSQEIQCIDTVTISGYFFKENKWGDSIEELMRTKFSYPYFIPVHDVKARGGLIRALLHQKWVEDYESDTIGYCTYKPHRYIYEPDRGFITSISNECKQLLARCITPVPFSSRNEMVKINATYQDPYVFSTVYAYKHPIIISFAKVKWLKLKVKSEIADLAKMACGTGPGTFYEGFGRSSNLRKGREYKYFTIYVAIELLEVNHDVELQGEDAQTPFITVILPKRVL